MFSKPTNPPSNTANNNPANRAPVKVESLPMPVDVAPARRGSPQVPSLVAADITIEGGLSGEGELHVDGVVRGDIRVARLTIGETGHVEGSVQAEAVEVRGRVIGALAAKQVRLLGTAYVDGDITHEQLALEQGAFFQGRSLRMQRPPTPAAQPLKDEKPAPITPEIVSL